MEISTKEYDTLMSNPREKGAWRLHEINWDAKNIPYKRNDLNWISSNYLHNTDEFPFFQFQITKAHGRVIGFWDETGVFNIVLLDPLHNMQPSAYTDYKLRDTSLARSDYAAAIASVEAAISSCSDDCQCRAIYGDIQDALAHGLPPHTMLVSMSDDIFDRSAKCIADGLAQTLSDIIDTGLKDLQY